MGDCLNGILSRSFWGIMDRCGMEPTPLRKVGG